MHGMTKNILKLIQDPVYVRDLVARARKKTGGPNACAATLSYLAMDLKLINKVFTWTADLVGSETEMGELEVRHPLQRISHPADMQAGDFCASRDRPDDNNLAPDHAFTLYSDPEGGDLNNPFALVIDNYCRNGKPYWRNLGRSGWYKGLWRGKTPVAYSLRFIAETPTRAQLNARQQLVDELQKVYQLAKRAGLTKPTLHALNEFRHGPELGRLRISS